MIDIQAVKKWLVIFCRLCKQKLGAVWTIRHKKTPYPPHKKIYFS